MHPALFEAYAGDLRKAVAGVLGSPNAGDKYFDLQQKLTLNVSRFAAAKAYQATRVIDRLRADGNGVMRPKEAFRQLARRTLNAFNRYQAAEHNAAVARARTAMQWLDFNADGRKNALLPNIKWLPSRSVERREEHIAFYNKVWAKDDPFWEHNQPGNLWSCKCDWIETDEPVSGEPHDTTPAKGLAGNPAKTGKVFSDDASYYARNALKKIEDMRYADSESKLEISVLADAYEIGDNVRTGRILLGNHSVALEIRKHLFAEGLKNPEYLLDNMLADAKRVQSWNVSKSFRSAIKQGAKVVIIDLYKKYDPSTGHARLDSPELAKNIARRVEDFKSGRVERCYVVLGKKSIEITKNMFDGNTYRDVSPRLEELLNTLL